jgi:hypothetical protein
LHDCGSPTIGAVVRHLILALCFLALLGPTASSAQTPPPTWPPLTAKSATVLYTPTRVYHDALGMPWPADTVARHISPTYWREGGLIGAGSVGAFMAYFIYGFCQDSDTVRGSCADELVRGGLLGGLVGFGIGALVGGQFPKHRSPGAPGA